MKKTICLLLVLVCAEFSVAQFANVPIDNEFNDQSQPSIAVSPTYDFFLGSAWNSYPDIFNINVGWAISIDRGLTWIVRGYLSTLSGDPSIAFDRSGQYSTSLFGVFSELNEGRPTSVKCFRDADFVSVPTSIQISSEELDQINPQIVIDNNTASDYEGNIYVAWGDYYGPAPVGNSEMTILKDLNAFADSHEDYIDSLKGNTNN